MIAFGDAAYRVTSVRLDFGWTPLGRAPDSGVGGGPVSVPDANRLARARHSGFWNLGFCDGHVQALRLETVFFDESDSARQRWNRDHESHR
jgi:prepilin-type processing-associated H-X9-DG protein